MIDLDSNIAWLSDQPLAFWLSAILVGLVVAAVLRLPSIGIGALANLKRAHIDVLVISIIEIIRYQKAKKIDLYVLVQTSSIIKNVLYFFVVILIALAIFLFANYYLENPSFPVSLIFFMLIIGFSANLGTFVGATALSIVRLNMANSFVQEFLLEGKKVDLPGVIQFLARIGRVRVDDVAIYLDKWPALLLLLKDEDAPTTDHD